MPTESNQVKLWSVVGESGDKFIVCSECAPFLLLKSKPVPLGAGSVRKCSHHKAIKNLKAIIVRYKKMYGQVPGFEYPDGKPFPMPVVPES